MRDKRNDENEPMERITAVRLLSVIESMTPPFNEIDLVTSEIADEVERKELRLTVAKAMTLLAFDLVMHVVRQYPDLDPDKGRYEPPLKGQDS